MAHIPDGILSLPVLLGGAALAAGGVGLALRQMDDRAIPRVALLSAVFFAGSLISAPVGPSSLHLLMAGLMGVMLGMGIFPAVLVALTLQAVLFGLGGLTTLGVNTVSMALPGALIGLGLGPVLRRTSPAIAAGLAGLGAAAAVLGTAGMVALFLWLSSSDFVPVAQVLLATYLPLAALEAVLTATVVGLLATVDPTALRPKGTA